MDMGNHQSTRSMDNNLQENEAEEMESAPLDLDDEEEEYIEFMEDPLQGPSRMRYTPCPYVPDKLRIQVEPSTSRSIIIANRNIGVSSVVEDENSNIEADPNAFKWLEGPHPLLIPDVVRDIFERLGMQDVEHCRQVCRVWNEEACSVLQSKKIIALLEIEAVKYYIDKIGDTSYFPHSSFELHIESIFEQDVMLKFWTQFGSHIKWLDLRQCTLFIETLFDIIDRYLPNLECLSLRTLPKKLSSRRSNQNLPPVPISQMHPPQQGRQDLDALRFPQIKELTLCYCPQDEENTVIMLKDLIRSMPNLERLLVTDIPSLTTGGAAGGVAQQQQLNLAASGTRVRVARMLVKVLTDSTINLPQLKRIDFPIEVGNTELSKLAEKGYRFSALSLKLSAGTKSSNLKDFLSTVSGSIRFLEITFPDGFFVGGITFPAYSQLKNAEALLHLSEVRELSLTNFNGPLEHFKNLRKLKTVSLNEGSLDSFSAPTKLLLPVPRNFEHALWCLKMDSVIDSDVVLSISLCFPLLRVIKISGLDDNGLGIVYRNLPYITELEILNGKITDQGLSGVPLEVCKDMAETATFHFVEPAKFRRDLFLGSLEYLKTLKLVCDDVSDISIAFGIVDCRNLQKLTLHSPSISDIGLIKIADRMVGQLHYLDIHECENVSEEGKFYVKEKLKHIELILEPYALQKQKSTDNPNRQVGYPYRGRSIRPERYGNLVGAVGGAPGADEDFDRLPLRERMFMAMDRRRRFITLRMIQRVGRAPGAPAAGLVGAAAAQMELPEVDPANEDELRFLMDLQPMFQDDEAGNFLMNFENGEDSDSDAEIDDNERVVERVPAILVPPLQNNIANNVQNNLARFGEFFPAPRIPGAPDEEFEEMLGLQMQDDLLDMPGMDLENHNIPLFLPEDADMDFANPLQVNPEDIDESD